MTGPSHTQRAAIGRAESDLPMRSLASVLSALVLAAPALARHGDIGFRVESSAIATWIADDATGQFLEPERVFEGELLDLGGVITGDEPGYFGEPGTLAGQRLGFNVRRALRAWDVLSQSMIGPPTHTITISAPLVRMVTTPVVDPPAPNPGLSVLVPAAGLDFHFDHTLSNSAPGIYLLELELWTDAPGVAASLPFWVVLNYDMPEPEHEAAVQWVRDNLVPAPGVAPLALLGVLLAPRRRRHA